LIVLDAKTTLPENLSHLGCFLNRHNTYLLFRCEGEYTNVFFSLLLHCVSKNQSWHVWFNNFWYRYRYWYLL